VFNCGDAPKSNPGEPIAIREIVRWITEFNIVILNVSGFFPGPRQYIHQSKNRVTFYGAVIHGSNCQIYSYLNWWLVGNIQDNQNFFKSPILSQNLKFLNFSCHFIAYLCMYRKIRIFFLYFLLTITPTLGSGAWGENFRAYNAFSV
jgi:hypothetical protein